MIINIELNSWYVIATLLVVIYITGALIIRAENTRTKFIGHDATELSVFGLLWLVSPIWVPFCVIGKIIHYENYR